ncbi:hypothetical protein PP175_29210 (plasmid) [Aneurinibacillus sp. Ricciae_BoGa-3]|uniref:hypothetical protein n=1 Tax=Aneurinibacillus sp. Ricciae_BoGa-3 TaxID=3022697 RepID=UPI00234224B4|nr:hypothetical protein [Aneurinibacillus sp. Ricciae_BoGa-3]WCK57272.1 hypothetical protein PP175_29210 [Aneurinibacillus sp. Ricciae_BoGa-3]
MDKIIGEAQLTEDFGAFKKNEIVDILDMDIEKEEALLQRKNSDLKDWVPLDKALALE